MLKCVVRAPRFGRFNSGQLASWLCDSVSHNGPMISGVLLHTSSPQWPWPRSLLISMAQSSLACVRPWWICRLINVHSPHPRWDHMHSQSTLKVASCLDLMVPHARVIILSWAWGSIWECSRFESWDSFGFFNHYNPTTVDEWFDKELRYHYIWKLKKSLTMLIKTIISPSSQQLSEWLNHYFLCEVKRQSESLSSSRKPLPNSL